MVPLEGCDYSATAHADWPRLANALKASGKAFAGRYAVYDKSPGGRGITAAEYQAMKAAGIEVFLYWQTTTNWMLGGYNAGQAGAVNAQQNINGAGMPQDTVVYFACDFDARPDQQALIDECLRGAASVLGADRVGLYAGRWPLLRAMANGSAKWFCQTSAWSAGVIVDGIHLYQYAYNQFVDGTNCDWVRAYQENYGQAGEVQPPPEPGPIYADPAQISWKRGDVGLKELNGVPALAMLHAARVVRSRIIPYSDSTEQHPTGPDLALNDAVVVIGAYRGGSGRNGFAVLEDGSRVRTSALRPQVPLPPKKT